MRTRQFCVGLFGLGRGMCSDECPSSLVTREDMFVVVKLDLYLCQRKRIRQNRKRTKQTSKEIHSKLFAMFSCAPRCDSFHSCFTKALKIGFPCLDFFYSSCTLWFTTNDTAPQWARKYLHETESFQTSPVHVHLTCTQKSIKGPEGKES